MEKGRSILPYFLVFAVFTAGCSEASSPSSDNLSTKPPTRGLVAYFPFNGDATDQSGNGINGMVNGATQVEDRFGRAGRAYDFNGISSFISIPHDTLFNMGNNYAVSLWFKLSDVSGVRTLISKNKTQVGANDYLNLSMMQATGLFTARIGNGSEEFAVYSGRPLNDNLWHHAVVMVGTSLQIWIDGQLSNQATQTIEAKENSDSLIVGSWQGKGLFKGSIDDIRIYNRGLKFSEITALYNEE